MRLTVITFNYFKKYVQREIAKATGVSVYKPFQGRWREIRKSKWYYDENRPWTDAAKAANAPMKRNKSYILEPIADEEWTIFKGDRVSFWFESERETRVCLRMGVYLCVLLKWYMLSSCKQALRSLSAVICPPSLLLVSPFSFDSWQKSSPYITSY